MDDHTQRVTQTKGDEDHIFPSMDVNVEIPSVGIQLSEYQLKLLRSILEDNVSSRMSKRIEEDKQKDLSDVSLSDIKSAELKEISPPLTEVQESSVADKPLFVDIHVNVEIESIKATILTGNGVDPKATITKLGEKPAPLEKKATPTSLLSGDLRKLLVSVDMNSDNSMDVDLSITDLFIQDARQIENQNKFRDIFTTRLTKKLAISKPYFTLTYRQDPNNYQKVEISIYHPSLIYVPDIWVDMLIFILPFQSDILGATNAFTTFWSDFSPKLSPEKPVEVKKARETVNAMIVSLYMINAQMCVLEDPKRTDSNTLLLKADMDITYSTSQEDDKDVVFVCFFFFFPFSFVVHSILLCYRFQEEDWRLREAEWITWKKTLPLFLLLVVLSNMLIIGWLKPIPLLLVWNTSNPCSLIKTR